MKLRRTLQDALKEVLGVGGDFLFRVAEVGDDLLPQMPRLFASGGDVRAGQDVGLLEQHVEGEQALEMLLRRHFQAGEALLDLWLDLSWVRHREFLARHHRAVGKFSHCE